jgi:hypothetical protein
VQGLARAAGVDSAALDPHVITVSQPTPRSARRSGAPARDRADAPPTLLVLGPLRARASDRRGHSRRRRPRSHRPARAGNVGQLPSAGYQLAVRQASRLPTLPVSTIAVRRSREAPTNTGLRRPSSSSPPEPEIRDAGAGVTPPEPRISRSVSPHFIGLPPKRLDELPPKNPIGCYKTFPGGRRCRPRWSFGRASCSRRSRCRAVVVGSGPRAPPTALRSRAF